MGVNMPAIFADRIKPVEENLEMNMQELKRNPAVDVPILRERIHYSFVWDRLDLVGADDLNIDAD